MNNNQNLLNNQSFQLPVHADEKTKQTYLFALRCKALVYDTIKSDNFITDLLLKCTDIGTQAIHQEEAPIIIEWSTSNCILDYAISIGDIVTVELALKAEYICTLHLLFSAIQYGQADIVDIINKYTSYLQNDTMAKAALHVAFYSGEQEIVDLILNSNPTLADSYQAQAPSLEIA